MPPKKKGNKKAQDDWEADLGESIAPQDAAAEPQAEEPAADEDVAGGGLMAALAKRGKKKGKKAAQQDWEAELGEDPSADAGNDALASKAPEEANFDEDDVFAGNFKPKKEKKEEKEEEKKAPVESNAPRVKTKAEKEKEKKEKEKQRKKEMVCFHRRDNKN